jgi:hypothetical protein
VRAARAWISAAAITIGALFLRIDRHGRTHGPLTAQRVRLVVMDAATFAAFDPARFAGHSLRAGLATAAGAAGVSERAIMAQTGHGFVVVARRYVRHGKPASAEIVLKPGTSIALENGNGHAVFTVTQAAQPARIPRAGATVTAIDFGFRGASTLRDGELVRFQNNGYLIHMFLYAQAKSVADARKAEALLLAATPNKANKYGTGVKGMFAAPLSHGQGQQEIITQPPGVYVILRDERRRWARTLPARDVPHNPDPQVTPAWPGGLSGRPAKRPRSASPIRCRSTLDGGSPASSRGSTPMISLRSTSASTSATNTCRDGHPSATIESRGRFRSDPRGPHDLLHRWYTGLTEEAAPARRHPSRGRRGRSGRRSSAPTCA